VKEIKICNRKKCGHFVIQRLVKELGGLGVNDFKIKSKEEFENLEKKVKKLNQEVKKFETRVVDFFDIKGFYPCDKYMEICWGRRKCLNCISNLKLKEKELLRLEVKK
jgi:hypothetical protein